MTTRHWWHTDSGVISAFVATLTLALIVLAGLVLDGGLALAAKVHADGQAEAAARAGAQALDLDAYRSTGAVRLAPAEAASNARAYLAGQGTTGMVVVVDDTVTVTVTADQPTQLLQLIGITSLSVHGHGSARPRQE